jgi:hypothetical protein
VTFDGEGIVPSQTKLETDMSNKIHELSSGDLDEVSGGLRNFPFSTSITPSIPIPPPEGPGPVVPPGHGPFFVNGPGVFEL